MARRWSRRSSSNGSIPFDKSGRPAPAEAFDESDVGTANLFPHSASRIFVSSAAHLFSAEVVAEQDRDLTTESGGVTEGHETAPTVGQQLLGVPVRGRDRRSPTAECVRERPRCYLVLVDVGSDVNVR